MNRRLTVDTTALRESRGFRWQWGTSLVSAPAAQVGVFAVVVQVFELTGSSLAVGAIGLFVAAPTILFALVGGALADALDRRTMLRVTAVLNVVVAACFVAQAVAGLGSLAVIYALVAVQATLGALAVPARRAAMRRMVSAASLPGALALGLIAMHAAQVVGPLLGGSLAGASGVAACYLVQLGGAVVAVVGQLALPGMPPAEGAPRPGPAAVGRALAHILRTPVLRGALAVDLAMTVFGVPFAVFPALNAERFGGAPETLGMLSAAVALGGVVGAGMSGPLGTLGRPGRALILAAACWCVAVVALAIPTALPVAIAVLVVLGGIDAVALTLGQSIVQNETPDELRGRVAAAEQIVQMGGPQLGGLRAGALAGALGPASAIALGGAVALAAVGLVAWRSPQLRQLSRSP